MLREQLSNAYKDSLRAQDTQAVSTLRLILAALKDRDIAARGKGNSDGISEDEVLEMLQKMVRQRRESIKMYEEGGRLEPAEREQGEIDVIQRFLPQMLGEEDIKAAVTEVIDETGAAGLKDMGRCMATLKSRYPGQMDFCKASGLVKERLAS